METSTTSTRRSSFYAQQDDYNGSSTGATHTQEQVFDFIDLWQWCQDMNQVSSFFDAVQKICYKVLLVHKTYEIWAFMLFSCLSCMNGSVVLSLIDIFVFNICNSNNRYSDIDAVYSPYYCALFPL